MINRKNEAHVRFYWNGAVSGRFMTSIMFRDDRIHNYRYENCEYLLYEVVKNMVSASAQKRVLHQLNESFLNEIGGLSRFTGRFFKQGFRPRYEIAEFIRQCFVIGYKSFPLIGLTSFILGLVLTMQLRPSMVSYGVESQLPAIVGIAVIREIGPVITALIFAGKIGSSIGAELGSMRVTEQIDAMEVSGTNPFKYLVVTRVLAATLMLPVLVLLGDAISLMGSWIGINIRGATSFHLYWTQVFNNLAFTDVLPAFFKSFFFGYAVGIIGCFKGYHSSKGTEGVGISANSAVVLSSIVIFILDLIAVQVTDALGLN